MLRKILKFNITKWQEFLLDISLYHLLLKASSHKRGRAANLPNQIVSYESSTIAMDKYKLKFFYRN